MRATLERVYSTFRSLPPGTGQVSDREKWTGKKRSSRAGVPSSVWIQRVSLRGLGHESEYIAQGVLRWSPILALVRQRRPLLPGGAPPRACSRSPHGPPPLPSVSGTSPAHTPARTVND